MADKQGMVYKFFQRWKEKRLNKFAKDMLKDNPSLEKDLKQMDNNMQQLLAKLKKQGSRR